MPTNKLYYGDNLHVLRDHIASESVDLVYLDPPFNSKADYNLLFREDSGRESSAQIVAFEDAWHWTEETEAAYLECVERAGSLGTLIAALRECLGRNDMMAYLVMMAARLVELRRVLKPTGSLYLHCDARASHYLKLVMDAVFGVTAFQNEIVWLRTVSKSLMTRRFPSNHDVILAYQRGDSGTWNIEQLFQKYDLADLDDKTEEKYSQTDADGRRFQLTSLINPNQNRPNLRYEFLGVMRVWRWTRDRMQKAYDEGLVVQPSPGAVPRFKRYLDEQRGKPIGDVWTDIPPLNARAAERLGYPTQKPEALLERIILASTNPGDVVLDPFCGCGTTVSVAERTGRKWIGIDITHLAIDIMRKRLRTLETTLGRTVEPYEVVGEPRDVLSAKALAIQSRMQFQLWALSCIHAEPYRGRTKGGPDTGIDGMITFVDDSSAKPKKLIVSVKSGHVKPADVRDLRGVIAREGAELGALVTLEPPTKGMRDEAVAAGFYKPSSILQAKYPRLQLITVSDLIDGIGLSYPKSPPARPARKPRPAPVVPEQIDLMFAPTERARPKSRFDRVVERRAAVSAIIVDRLHADRNFGRTKFAKVLFLADLHCDLGLEMEYARQAAGPLDARALYNNKIGIEAVASRHGVFTATETGDFVRYAPGPKLPRAVQFGWKAVGNAAPRLDALIGQIAAMDTDQVEIVATLYACWNDILLESREVTDDAIIAEFAQHWHDRKQRFARGRLVKALAWMRTKGIVPSGSGKPTVTRAAVS